MQTLIVINYIYAKHISWVTTVKVSTEPKFAAEISKTVFVSNKVSVKLNGTVKTALEHLQKKLRCMHEVVPLQVSRSNPYFPVTSLESICFNVYVLGGHHKRHIPY